MRQVGLHAQTRKRCFELVSRVCQKTFLGGDRIFEACQQVIERCHQGRDFFGHVMAFERTQVIWFALTNAFAQSIEWFDAVAQCEPYQEHDQRQYHQLWQQDAFDNFGRQYGAFFKRFADLHKHGLGVR